MELKSLLERITGRYPTLSPQLKQAAKFVLDQPAEVAINSMRRVAAQADVAPSTMLRLAKALDFESYEGFRMPFRESLRERGEGFGDRAQWLQGLGAQHDEGDLVRGMAEAGLSNIESAFRINDPAEFASAANMIRNARRVYVLGAGGGAALSHYFFYVARMAMENLVGPASRFGVLVDNLVDFGADDVAVAATFHPYTRQTVDAVEMVRRRGGKLISITDSRASPLAEEAAVLLLAPTASPQFFPSYTAALAVMETLIAFMVSKADRSVVDKIAEIERFRFEHGVYWHDGESSEPAAK